MKFLYIHCHKHLLLLYLSLKILNHQKMLLVFKHTTQYILLKLSINPLYTFSVPAVGSAKNRHFILKRNKTCYTNCFDKKQNKKKRAKFSC